MGNHVSRLDKDLLYMMNINSNKQYEKHDDRSSLLI